MVCLTEVTPKHCECGCGQEVKNRFTRGHNGNRRGVPVSEETRNKYRIRWLGEKNPMKNPETARKTGNTRRGMQFTAVHRRNMGKAKKDGYARNPKSMGWAIVAPRIRSNGGTQQELLVMQGLKEFGISHEKDYKVFCPESTQGGRRYFAIDFAFLTNNLAIEIDGASHDLERDKRKDAFLEAKGWRVMRFSNETVDRDLLGVIEAIKIQLGGD